MSKKTKILLTVLGVFVIASIVFMTFMKTPNYYKPEKMQENYVSTGYKIEVFDSCKDITGITRIVAYKGDSIAEITYTKNVDQTKDILNYYSETYDRCYIMGNRAIGGKNIIYYASDEIAWKTAEIKEVNISIDPIKVDGLE